MLRKKVLSVLLSLSIAGTVITCPYSSPALTGYDSTYVYADGEMSWSFEIETFVRGLYVGCLGREPEQDGLTYWCSRLASGEITGKQAAYGFFFSQEFIRDLPVMTEEEVINRYYNVFLGRWADPDGLNYWTELLRSGQGPDELFEGFADSQEFASRCEAAGINPGPHLSVPNVTDFWGPYSTGFNLMRLRYGQPIDDAAVIQSIMSQCDYFLWLENSGSPDALHYLFGGKSMRLGGGMDCSGWVTAIYKRAFGTQTMGYGSVYDSSIYTSSQTFMGNWSAGETRCPPLVEGVYYTNGDPARPIFTDRYGISSAYAMNTFQWHYYFDALGFSGNSMLTWHCGDYTQQQIETMLNNRGYKPGDIIIWYTTAVDAPHSVHMGIYAGNGWVWHCSSSGSNGVQSSAISSIGSSPNSSIQYCRIYHMS